MTRTVSAILLLAVAAPGCSARPATGTAAARAPSRAEEGGWVRLGGGVRLREDAPPLASVLPEPQPPAPRGDYGPRGDTGASTTWSEDGYVPPCTSGSGGFWAPGGAVPPGMRAPHDDPPSSPFAAAYGAAAQNSDVADHRPGLSTGNSTFGRDR